MAEETKKPRKLRAKRAVIMGSGLPTSNIIVIDDAKELPNISGHTISKVTKKGKKIEVEMTKNPGWETPIYEVLGHPKFIELLNTQMKNLRNENIPAGKKRHPYLQKVIDQYSFNQEQMKIEYIKIMNKDCQLPSGIRAWIEHIVETVVFLTIKFYEEVKS